MSVATSPKTFDNILDICERRGRIIGNVKENDRDLMKGYIQEYYMRISTERSWPWRSFDRSFNIYPSITNIVTGGPVIGPPNFVSVTEGSRVITFTSLAIGQTFLGRSIRIDEGEELYRIIGVKTSTKEAYLESPYVGTTNASAIYRIYQYEFPLPPDCDTINNIYIHNEFGLNIEEGQLDEISLPEFNRLLSTNSTYIGAPVGYCRDGKTYVNSSLPPLDEMILDYDFLGGEVHDKTEKLRIFPIDPDRARPIHLNYSIIVSPLLIGTQEPLIPYDDRWVLVHFSLYEWFSDKGQKVEAEKQLRDGKMILREMRNEHRKGQTKPKFIVGTSGFRRYSNYENNNDKLFRMSRALEY